MDRPRRLLAARPHHQRLPRSVSRGLAGIRHGEPGGGCGTRAGQRMRRMARLDPGDLTMLIRSVALLLGVILPLFLGDAARAATQEFGAWLQALRRDALADGVSKATVDAALTNVTLIDRVIELDRQQPEFTLTFQEYVERVVPQKRVDRGRELLVEYRDLLTQVSRRYGVPPRFIVALWAIESDYGRVMGDFPIIDALVTLSYDGRRSSYFRSELMQALHILDEQRMAPAALTGSWAGAMGQSQFMPSSFRRFAVDQDGDGKADIWNDQADVFASIAHYLSALGWNATQGWGIEVRLPARFDTRVADSKAEKTVAAWQKLGVRTAAGGALPNPTVKAYVVLPAGATGPAYLAYPNFKVILKWNRSDFFAIAAGLLADRIGAN